MKHSTTLAIPTLALCAALTHAQAQVNYTLAFDGSGDHINVGTLVGTGIRSIEFWFNPATTIDPSSLVGGRSLIIRNDEQQGNEFGIYIRGQEWPTGRGALHFFMRDNGVLHEVFSDNDTWIAGTWYHICGTMDEVAGMKLYVDGVQQASVDPSGTIAVQASPETTALGRWGDQQIRFFAGRMDELRLWDRAITQQEIEEKKCYWLNAANETGLLAYWRMDEGSGAVIEDLSGFDHAGAIVGATYVEDPRCVQGTVGVEDLSAEVSIQVQPNPITTQATVRLDHELVDAMALIIDGTGRVMRLLGPFNGRSAVIDTGDLAEGMYTLLLLEKGRISAKTRVLVVAN